MNDKVKLTFEIYEEHEDLLKAMVEKYSLPDTSKALRILLDYLAEDGDQDEIYENIRCRQC